jgi:aerobic carbon-monoxide dehydrogenase large subunit
MDTECAGGWIGRAMPRREDPRLLRGQGQFVDDITPDGTLYLEVVRSPFAAGKITALDVSDAARSPGVRLVLTASDLRSLGKASVNALLPGGALRPMRLLADGDVAAIGQGVAAIVADTRAAALDAVELVTLEVSEEGTMPAPVVTHQWRSAHGRKTGGRFVSVTQAHPLVAPMALEPRAALAIPTGEGLVVHLSTQTPQRCRDDLAAVLGMDAKFIRVIAKDVGGAFGGKASVMPEDALVALAARHLQRPVKWTATRGEDFLAATQGRGARLSATMFLDDAGAPTGLDADITFPLGYWMPYSALAPIRNAGRILPGPYLIPDVHVRACAEATAGPAVNIYRGAGRPEAAMLMERLADRAAEASGQDPLDWRLNHLAEPGLQPTGEVICSGDYAGLLHRLAAETDYRTLRANQGHRRVQGEVCGIGLAIYVEPCGQGWETAAVSLNSDGRITARSGSSAQGQGRETAMAQIVAEALGCTPDRVSVLHSDSGEVPVGIGALASRSTAIGGTAMWRAASDLAEKARAVTALRLRCATSDVHLGPDGALAGDDRLSWAEIAADAPLSAECRHEAQAEAWASGAVLAEVAVDPDTGALTIERITWVDDAGRILNPMLAEGQLMGGLAQGLGAVLMERIVYADGQLLTGSLMDYAVPRASDMPPVRLIGAPTPSPANPLGFKGLGEAGCIGVPAAILNAVQDALRPFGAPDLSLPLTSETIWRAIMRMP